MKTPDEIKKWLECCTHGTCNSCPYFGDECDSDREVIDTLEYIQQLERKIGELTDKVAQLEAAAGVVEIGNMIQHNRHNMT